MASRKAPPGEVLSLEEAERETGLSRASLFNYMKKLHLDSYKFAMDRRTYLDVNDVARIKAYKTDPRKVGAIATVREKKTPKVAV